MPYKHTPYRRCHWFENDGSPRTQKNGAKGCTHHSCHFIHPDDPEWRDAIKTRSDPPPPPARDADRNRDGDRYKDSRDLGVRDRERDRDIDRARDKDRGRDMWQRERGREREGARSPRAASSGPNTPASTARDTRLLRTPILPSPAAAVSGTGTNSLPLGGSSPLKSASTSSLPTRNITTPSLADRVRSPSLSRNTSAPTSETYAREPGSSFGDRGGYRDRDKSPSTSSDARLRAYRLRQNSAASATTTHSQVQALSSSPTITNPMPPPPPTLKLATPRSSTTLSPTATASLPTATGQTSASSATTQELGRLDKAQLWVDRIKQLADAVQVRALHVALERELVQLKALLTSRQHANLSDAARANLDKQVKTTEEQCTAKRSELNELVYKLASSQFWDASLTWSGFNADTSKGKGKERELGWDGPNVKGFKVEERFKELSTVVWQVRDGVTELYKMMAELQDTAGVEDRPSTKRRRPSEAMDVTDSAVQPTPSTRASSQPRASSLSLSAQRLPTPPRELESISDRLNAIDDRISDIENIMVQFDSDAITELEARMEERFQELNLSHIQSDDDRMAVDNEPPDTGQGTTGQRKTAAERLQYVEREMERAGEDLTGIAHEIAEIITNAQTTDDEMTRLKKENQEMKERIATLEQQSLESAETLKAFKAEMEALNTALQMFISRPTSPPPAPPTVPVPPPAEAFPDIETIMEAVGPRLLQSVRQDIAPMFEDLKDSVQEMTTKQNTQLAQNVMNKLQLTFKTVEVIYAWMNRTVAAQMPPPPAPAGSPAVMSPAQIPHGSVATNGVLNGTSMGTMPPPMTGSTSRIVTPILTVRNGVPVQIPLQAIPAKPVSQ